MKSQVKLPAIRPVFMTKSSDAIGYSLNNQSGAINLLIRKVQEKCKTIRELMAFTRRFKLTDDNRIDQGEFHNLLRKFGVVLPLETVKIIFNLYDNDRSGSIDFDEFAQWVMNDEYYNPNKVYTNSMGQLKPLEDMRSDFGVEMKVHPQTFVLLEGKQKVGYMDLMCDINRVRMKSVSDNDVRAVFLLLDPGNTGFIDASGFIHWIKTGLIATRVNKNTPDVVPLLKNSVSRKKYSSSVMNAEKRFRTLLQNGFKSLRNAIEENPIAKRTGHISVDLLHCLINRNCGILSPLDFSLIMHLVKTDVANKRSVEVRHFVDSYLKLS